MEPEPEALEPEPAAYTETLLPHVTIWPAALAAGVTLFFAGLINNIALIVVGALVCALGLYGWIQEMRHEQE